MKYIYNAKKGGIFCPKYQIAPWPGFILRRRAIIDAIDYIPPEYRKFIEIGFGTGIISYEFYRKRFSVTGYDIEKKSVKIANDIFNSGGKKIMNFKSQLTKDDRKAYDCLGAFEVLEHAKDDAGILREWKNLIKDGGMMILSVPSKMKYWGPLDLRVGHKRRYEKKKLAKLLENSGFQIIKIISYGFPFMNAIAPFSDNLVHKKAIKRLKNLSSFEKTKLCGFSKTFEYKYKNFIPFHLMEMCSKTQRLFYDLDLGRGYVVAARKK